MISKFDPRAPKRLLDAADELVSRAEAQRIIESVVKLSKADAVQVNLGGGRQRNVRFAANQMSTAGMITDLSLVVTSSFGPKHAITTTNDLSPEGIERAVRQSEAIARLAPDDPEAMPYLAQQNIAPLPSAWDDATVNLTADACAAAARTALDPARAKGTLQAAGFLQVDANINALGNNAGLFAYHRGTKSNYTLTVRTADGTGSGWAGAEEPQFSAIDFAKIGARAIEKAELSRNPVAIEPGRYTVILEPQAVGDLVALVGFYADARSADEGRSPFVKPGGGNKIGEKIVDERVSLYSDPYDARILSDPFDGEGFPLTRRNWIDKGVLTEMQYGRFWAKKQNKQPTGGLNNIVLAGGTTTREQMIASTQRGILVSRLWYLREVDPRTLLYTGLTRDGTFLIENGKITKAIKNMRFNESPLFMLNNLEALGPVERVAGVEALIPTVMPYLKARDFNFTSLSDAV
jgi:predicted Zn-dependent protease